MEPCGWVSDCGGGQGRGSQGSLRDRFCPLGLAMKRGIVSRTVGRLAGAGVGVGSSPPVLAPAVARMGWGQKAGAHLHLLVTWSPQGTDSLLVTHLVI